MTFIKAPASLFKLPPHCFIRDRAGRALTEITNATLQFPVDQSWTNGYLSSNQPEVFSAFYLMLRPRLGTGSITLGAANRLLHDYTKFAEQRLKDAISHYGAEGAWCIQLRWMTVPDEIDFVATSPLAAAAIARRVGGEPNGNTVRVSSQTLDALTAQRGDAFVVAQPAEVDVVTPWRFTTGLPPVRDHAALIQVGWVRYRVGSQPPRTDFVGLLLNSTAPRS